MTDDSMTWNEATRAARLARYVYWTQLGDRDRGATEPSEASLDAWRATVLAVQTPLHPPCLSAYWLGAETWPAQLLRCDRSLDHVDAHGARFVREPGTRALLEWSDAEGIDL